MPGESSYVSFQTKILKQGQLLSENSQDTHWTVIFLPSEEIHFTLYGPNPKFTEVWGFSLTLMGFRSDLLKKTNHKVVLYHLAASPWVGIQLKLSEVEPDWDFHSAPSHMLYVSEKSIYSFRLNLKFLHSSHPVGFLRSWLVVGS